MVLLQYLYKGIKLSTKAVNIEQAIEFIGYMDSPNYRNFTIKYL